MWTFLPFGFFSAVWCQTPDRYSVAVDPSKMDDDFKKKHALFPNGAMMIRARTQEHLEMLLADFARYLIALHESNTERNLELWKEYDETFGFTQDCLDFDMDMKDAVLGSVMCMFPILEQVGSDYRFRIFMERDMWAFYMFNVNMNIDYSNFKNEAKRFANITGEMDAQDKRYMAALNRIWSVMYGLQAAETGTSTLAGQTLIPFPTWEEDIQAQADWEDADYLEPDLPTDFSEDGSA
tara:strand:- start:6 stop:719 length:714 start_codon:yes stop_codon:yes gene_type:complete